MNLKYKSKELCIEYTPSHGAKESKEASGSGTQTQRVARVCLMHHRCKLITWSETAKEVKPQITAREMSMLVSSVGESITS